MVVCCPWLLLGSDGDTTGSDGDSTSRDVDSGRLRRRQAAEQGVGHGETTAMKEQQVLREEGDDDSEGDGAHSVDDSGGREAMVGVRVGRETGASISADQTCGEAGGTAPWQPSVLWQPPSAAEYIAEMERKVESVREQRAALAAANGAWQCGEWQCGV
jgi:hypothetical protein